MQDYYFIHNGTSCAFFVTDQRCASIFITRTEYQVSIIRTPSDTVERLARWRKYAEISKDKFMRIYEAATAFHAPGKQQYLELLSPYPVNLVE